MSIGNMSPMEIWLQILINGFVVFSLKKILNILKKYLISVNVFYLVLVMFDKILSFSLINKPTLIK